MRRVMKLALVIVATVAVLLGAGPVVATSAAEFSACIAHHATNEGGFTREHNPGVHQGFTGFSGCPDH